MDKDSFTEHGYCGAHSYTEYGYRGVKELSDALHKIRELEEELKQVKSDLKEEREQREAMVR